MPDLTREEVERRLAKLHDTMALVPPLARNIHAVAEREALQTAQALYAKLDELAAERDDWRDAAKVNRDEARKLEAVAEAAESSHHALAMGENITPAFERLGHALAAWREAQK